MDHNKNALTLHLKNRGKIEIKSKIKLKDSKTLSAAYTPGVAEVCRQISRDKRNSWTMTNRASQVAIVCDGTAILGLGDLGPESAMPVMEGKSAIFKEFAGIDAIPLCINTTDPKEIIKFCRYIEPSFGGINLEDIAAPACFEILEALEKDASIPVFHDDQDGTAIVVLAALINASRVLKKKISKLNIIINGAGAAGMATARLLMAYGVHDLLLLDSKGIVDKRRTDMNSYKNKIAQQTNRKKLQGGLKEALVGADVFIGLSKGNQLDEAMVRSMQKNPIIFALANPTPEIMPDKAKKAGAAIIGTGRSDFPNQINNALVFPGIFRGLLEYKIKNVTAEIKITVAQGIASTVVPTKNKILPSVMDKNVPKKITLAMKKFKPKK